MSNFGVRNYDDGVGRFMSVDVLWEKYRSLTPYQYAGNNPLILRDPSGFGWFGDLFGNTSQKALNLLERGKQRILNSFSGSISLSVSIAKLGCKGELGPLKLEGKAKVGNIGMKVKQSAEGPSVKIHGEGITGGVDGQLGRAKGKVGVTIAQAEVEVSKKGVDGKISGISFDQSTEVADNFTLDNSGTLAIGGELGLASGEVSWSLMETLVGGIEVGQGIFQMIVDNTIGLIEENMKDASMMEK